MGARRIRGYKEQVRGYVRNAGGAIEKADQSRHVERLRHKANYSLVRSFAYKVFDHPNLDVFGSGVSFCQRPPVRYK